MQMLYKANRVYLLMIALLFEICYYFTMQNYYLAIPLETWQRMAHEACYDIDQNVKSEAQNFFLMFMDLPNIDLIANLIQQASDTLLFVLFSYLYKIPQQFTKSLDNLKIILTTISQWQFTGITFLRSKSQPTKGYTTRTIISAIGNLLKCFYQHQANTDQVIIILKLLPPSYLQLCIYRAFIEAVSVVDAEMGFIRYRAMVFRFQDQMMPLVCESLMPFFYSIEDTLRISQLSALQAGLEVDQKPKNINMRQLQLTEQNQKQAQYIFTMLKEIVEFNYNITYSEYQNDQVIDSCLISFPDGVIDKIIDHDFLNAVFFIIEKVTEAKKGQKKNQYLAICLNCLAKMMQSRLTYITEIKKERFVLQAVKGLSSLLIKCQQIGSQSLLEGILICDRKLFMNIDLSYIKKICKNDPLSDSNNLYITFLDGMCTIIVQVIQRSSININNTLIAEAIELALKIILSYGYKDEESIDPQIVYFQNLVKKIIQKYILSLSNTTNIFASDTSLLLSDNKSLISSLFANFKSLSSYNYDHLFRSITDCLEYFLNLRNGDHYMLANILFLLSEMVDRHFLDRNLFITKAKDQEVQLLAKLVKRVSEIMIDYTNTRHSQARINSLQYLDVSVIIFTEAMLTEYLGMFDMSSGLKIKSKLYRYMMNKNILEDFFEPEDPQSEQTIVSYINILLSYLTQQNGSHKPQLKIQYALDTIQKCIFKLKWGMKRDYFLRSRIFKDLTEYFQQFTERPMVLYQTRSRVSKIIVTLNFDDILDEYKFRIDKVIKIIKGQNILVLLYNLIGIFQGIQTITIVKYFCSKLKREMDMKGFFKNLFQLALNLNDQKIYKDTFKLCKFIALNKGLKGINCKPIYELLSHILPNITILLIQMNSINSINIQLWNDSILELMETLIGMVGSGHINLFLLDFYMESSFTQFVLQLFQLLRNLSQDIGETPKIQELMLQLICNINREILDYIYGHQNPLISQHYNYILASFSKVTVNYIRAFLEGNKAVQDRLVKSIDIFKNLFIYCNKKSREIHKKVRINNLREYYIKNQAVNQILIYYMLSFILGNAKNNMGYVRSIAKVIYQMSLSYLPIFYEVLNQLRVQEQQMLQFRQICENFLKRETEDSFIDRIKIWIKQFA